MSNNISDLTERMDNRLDDGPLRLPAGERRTVHIPEGALGEDVYGARYSIPLPNPAFDVHIIDGQYYVMVSYSDPRGPAGTLLPAPLFGESWELVDAYVRSLDEAGA